MNIGSTINHDCIIIVFVTISSRVTIAGNVIIGDKCCIGIGAKIIDNTSIGKGFFIGAGAVVVKDITENVLAIVCLQNGKKFKRI